MNYYNKKESVEYEAELDKMINILVGEKQKEKGYDILKQILRNYDKLVKLNNKLESYKMPYWTIKYFMGK